MRTTDNSQLKSSSFDEKKQVYADSPYLLTSQVAALMEWTPTQIVDRQKQLAELAVKTWPILMTRRANARSRAWT